MGRIKSTMIKKAARQLLSLQQVFTEGFEHNKRLLGSTLPSKSIRNKVAGYLARLTKMKKAEAAKIAATVPQAAQTTQLEQEVAA